MALDKSAAAHPVDDRTSAPAALRDLKVLDIATFVAAPFCGTILADFGAEVIKIEQPKTGTRCVSSAPSPNAATASYG